MIHNSLRGKQKPKTFFAAITIFMIVAGCHKPPPDNPNPPDPPKSSEKLITSFSFRVADNSSFLISDVNSVIGSDMIAITLDKGINVSNMVPTITYTGISLSPAGNVAQNFNNDINYIVKAEDGSTKKYFVKIVFLTANQKIYIGSSDGNLYAINAYWGTLVWKFTTGDAILSSPTLVNNTIYVGSYDKYLYAIDATTGALKWKYQTTAPIRSESPVVSNGTVFISGANAYPDGTVYAVDAITGLLKWSKHIVIPTGPVVWGGKVFISSIEGGTYALDETNGNVVWYKNLGITRSNPAINNGKLYINTSGSLSPNDIECIDANDGNLIWHTASLPSVSGPSVDNGTVYISSANGTDQYMEAFDATTGNFKWRYRPIQTGASSSSVYPCPLASGSLAYSGFHYGLFYALHTTDGTLAWEFGNGSVGGAWYSNPAVGNRTVYTGGFDNYVYALDAATGIIKWKFLTNGPVYSGACIVDSDGNIFHAGSSGSQN